MKLDFCTIHFNYLTSTELPKAPKHCLMSQSIVDKHGKEVALMVIDYYTPIGKQKGWWCALRGPGYQKGKHPKHIIFIKEGLETPSMEQVQNCHISIESMINLGLFN
jgi:hypothetical protein